MAWWTRTKQAEQPATLVIDGVASNVVGVMSHPEEPPMFKRTYTDDIGGGFRIEISLRNGYGSVYDTSFLYQPNGRYIIFDCRAVADKIIDPALLPRVQASVDQILASDLQWRKSDPSEFVDEQNQRWVRSARALAR